MLIPEFDTLPEDAIQLHTVIQRGMNFENMTVYLKKQRAMNDLEKDPVSLPQKLNLIKGYQACVSYIDEQVGKLVKL